MIIKSKGYKSKEAIAKVIRYIIQEQKLESGEEPFLLTRFVRDKNKINKIIAQLEANEDHRIHPRKNANRIYMDILSFHKADSLSLTKSKLKALAREFVLKRCPKSISLVSMHTDTEHIHLHCVFSGLEFATGKAIRISQKRFKNIKLEMEAWQDHNLGLEHSRVDHTNPSRTQTLGRDYQWPINNEKLTKSDLKIFLNNMVKKVKSFARMTGELEKREICFYSRKEQTAGIIYRGRKYRLATLGIDKAEIQQMLEYDLKLDQVQERMLKLEHSDVDIKKVIKHEPKRRR